MYTEIYKVVYVDNYGKHEDKIMANDWKQLVHYLSKNDEKYGDVIEIKRITAGVFESAF